MLLRPMKKRRNDSLEASRVTEVVDRRVKVRLHKNRFVSEICGNVYPCFLRDIITVHLQCSSIDLWAGQL